MFNLSRLVQSLDKTLYLRGDERYGQRWRSIARSAKRETGGICCWCMRADAVEVHHAYYWKDGHAIRDQEIPGIDVFPVCANCHETLHTPKHWVSVSDALARKNIPSTIELLRRRFARCQLIYRKS